MYLAMYLRLSSKDEKGPAGREERDESNSIANQRKQICDFITCDPELCRYEVAEFCDDGYSGTKMERPGMQKLLSEVRENRVSCIIVKDMSRFSRDYIDMGMFLNQIFPFMGIRFIAINDHYDSREHQGAAIEMDTAFQTLLYDLYCKDISAKVKASFQNKCAAGEYVFGQVPFGYKKSREAKNAVIVNEKEAEVVRHIFSLAMQGKSSMQIARQLFEEKVPTITQMRRPGQGRTDGRIHTWNQTAVRNILNNRFYLGEWKEISGHHEALISHEIFDQVCLKGPEPALVTERNKHPLTGILYCGGCGYAMSYKPPRGKNRYRRFECRKHTLLQIPECCTYIRADLLEETVLSALKKELELTGNFKKLGEDLAAFWQAGIRVLKQKLREYKREKQHLLAEKDIMYEQYAWRYIHSDEAVPGEREKYRQRADEMTERIRSLSVKEAEAEKKLALLEAKCQKEQKDMGQMIGYLQVQELTPEITEIFINKISVYKEKRVEIEWNFALAQT